MRGPARYPAVLLSIVKSGPISIAVGKPYDPVGKGELIGNFKDFMQTIMIILGKR